MASASTSKHQDDNHDSSESDSDELSLSCGSSEFEMGENGSSGSDEELEEATGAMAGAQINPGIIPYQFEPYNSNSDESEPEDGEDEDRLADNSWKLINVNFYIHAYPYKLFILGLPKN